MARPKRIYIFKDKPVEFLDTYHGFWRFGVCYKEDKKFVSVRDFNGSRYRIPNSETHIKLTDVQQGNENN